MSSRLPKELHSIGGEDLCTVGQAGFPNAHRGFRGLFTCNEEVNKTIEKSGVVQPELDAPQKSGKKTMKIPGDLDHPPKKTIGSGQIGIKFPPNPDFPNKKKTPLFGDGEKKLVVFRVAQKIGPIDRVTPTGGFPTQLTSSSL